VGERPADRYLDEGIVAGLVAGQFPDLAGQPVTRLGAGWDHELFCAAEWIFRFPRRAGGVPWLRREIEVIAVAAETLGPVIPAFERIGEPTAAFPYPFVGYRRLPGVAADQVGPARVGRLADDIGALFSTLHRIDPARIPATPHRWEIEQWGAVRSGLAAAAGRVRPLLGPGLLARAGPYLAGQVTEPPRDGPRRFIHNDICPEHLLADPGTGRLTGLIDFTDAMVGDPVLDFTGLIGVGGRGFIDRVAARYTLPLDDGFGARLGWLTRTLTLTWLAEAADGDPASVPKLLTWVARAFAGSPP
jgi:aminoglycoside phosphotransferase (APT) family kinase protein